MSVKTLSFLIAAAGALAAYASAPAAQTTSITVAAPGHGKKLKGTDANMNGVRDDVEVIINRRYQDGEQNAAAMQYARSQQAVLDLPAGDKAAANRVKVLGGRAMACILLRFGGATVGTSPLAVAEKIVSMTFNSKARRRAYAQYNKTWLGTDWASDDGAACERI